MCVGFVELAGTISVSSLFHNTITRIAKIILKEHHINRHIIN